MTDRIPEHAAMSTDLFESHRPKLFGIAYRMLGTVADAEDALQEAYLRWHRSEHKAIDNPEAFLVTVTTRLCIDQLKSARVQRQDYTGPWLPEPLVDEPGQGPDARTELADTLSYAFILLLEQLDPIERAVYILREAFDLKHEEVATVVGKSPANCRQLNRRARARLQHPGKRFPASPAEQEKLLAQFLETCANGDLEQLSEMLAEDITVYSDGGGKVLAALRPLHGKARVMRFFTRLLQQPDPSSELRLCRINGQPGFQVIKGNKIEAVTTLTFVNGKIQQLFAVRNPEKLSRHRFSGSIV